MRGQGLVASGESGLWGVGEPVVGALEALSFIFPTSQFILWASLGCEVGTSVISMTSVLWSLGSRDGQNPVKYNGISSRTWQMWSIFLWILSHVDKPPGGELQEHRWRLTSAEMLMRNYLLLKRFKKAQSVHLVIGGSVEKSVYLVFKVFLMFKII